MGMAGKADIAPLFTVADALRNALAVRADRPLQWRPVPQGQVADIVEGQLLLTAFPEFWKLTVIFAAQVRRDGELDDASSMMGRGRREIGFGPGGKLERIALDLAMRGVPGGPTYADTPLTWEPVAGSLRMVVPGGELRIQGPGEGPCVLTHEDGVGIELLGVDGPAELQRHGLVAWGSRRSRPLRIVLKGHHHHLRSIEVAGVVGYHAVTDNILIALVQVDHELALIHMDGFITRPLARVSWGEALLGEPFDIDRLLREFSGANPGSTAKQTPARPGDHVFKFEPLMTADPGPPTGQAANADPRPDCPPGHTPMSGHHAALCRRYLRRLCCRLKGRGARKARELVLLILEGLEWCRHDITGTRREVHAELVRLLGRPLPGGDRNIRDCLDRLVEFSLLAEWAEGEGEGRRCTLLFGQLHDPNSALMRRIAEEDVAAEGDAAKGTSTGVDAGAPAPATDAAGAPGLTAVAGTSGEVAEVEVEAAEVEVEAEVVPALTPDPEAPLVAEEPSMETTPAPASTGVGCPAGAEPPPSPGVWEALARSDNAARAAPDSRAGHDSCDPGPLPGTRITGPPRPDVSLRAFVRGPERGDLFDPRLEVPGSPSHSMWDRKRRESPPEAGDDQEPP